jgi:peptidoglycan/LPS O-acetylase OafA/YrhL
MIGTWRLGLALLVVCAHLFHPWWPAAFAVFSFYVISGFLMTLILQEQYSFSRSGLKAFWVNRWLRIYPPYYFACLISIGLILADSNRVSLINGHLTIPDSTSEILTNALIFGLIDWPADRSSLVPPGWTLFIELAHYLLISLWAGRSKQRAYIFLALSVVYVACVFVFLDGFLGALYFLVPGGSFPFAVGVVLYFHRNSFSKIIASLSWPVAFTIGAGLYAVVFACASMFEALMVPLLYVNVLVSGILLMTLWHAPSSKFSRVDKFLGELSYPAYLLHWQAGIVVLLALDQIDRTVLSFALSVALSLTLALLTLQLVIKPLDRLRASVKSKTLRSTDSRASMVSPESVT